MTIDLPTILAGVALISVVGGAIAWFLRRDVIEKSRTILRETNEDLLSRLELVEKLGAECRAENVLLRDQYTALQARYDALHDIVTNKDAIATLAVQLAAWQKQTMRQLTAMKTEARAAGVAAKTSRKRNATAQRR